MWIERNEKFSACSKGIELDEKEFISIDEIQEGESKLILVIVIVNFTFIIILFILNFINLYLSLLYEIVKVIS